MRVRIIPFHDAIGPHANTLNHSIVVVSSSLRHFSKNFFRSKMDGNGAETVGQIGTQKPPASICKEARISSLEGALSLSPTGSFDTGCGYPGLRGPIEFPANRSGKSKALCCESTSVASVL